MYEPVAQTLPLDSGPRHLLLEDHLAWSFPVGGEHIPGGNDGSSIPTSEILVILYATLQGWVWPQGSAPPWLSTSPWLVAQLLLSILGNVPPTSNLHCEASGSVICKALIPPSSVSPFRWPWILLSQPWRQLRTFLMKSHEDHAYPGYLLLSRTKRAC